MLSKVGKGAIMARLDIKSAFRQLPIHPTDFCLLGYKINDLFFLLTNVYPLVAQFHARCLKSSLHFWNGS